MAVLVVARRYFAAFAIELLAVLVVGLAVAAVPPELRWLLLAGPAIVVAATTLPFAVVRIARWLLERR